MDGNMTINELASNPLIKLGAIIVAVFVAGWQGPKWIEHQLGDVFMPKAVAASKESVEALQEDVSEIRAEQQAIKSTMSYHLVDYKLMSALQFERIARDDLNDWREHPEQTAIWRAHEQDLVNRLKLAGDYRACVVANQTNCDNIRTQLLLH